MNKLTLPSVAFAACLGLSGMASAQTELSMWYHGAGNEGELKIINQIISDFNSSQSDWEVNLQSFPQASYNDSVLSAALAGNLPDILDVDGPVMPNWAWSGYLQPLQIEEQAIEGFLPGTLGYWNGKLYSVGLWDAAVALITRKSYMEQLGLRVPTLEQPWNKAEFMDALNKAKSVGTFQYPLDLGMAWKGEWYPYAFSPLMQSFGGDIVNRSSYKEADGTINGDDALAFGEWWKELFTNGYVPGTSQDPADRDSGFVNGKYAFAWNGNWAALGILEAFDDTLFLPAPDFGHGSTIGAASWQFGVSTASKNPEGASEFIRFAMQDKYMAAFSDQTGLIPPTKSAAAMTKHYKQGGALEVFYELSNSQAKVRPVTPGYVVAAKIYEKALADIADGADVADTLDAAADEIDADIKRNYDYGH